MVNPSYYNDNSFHTRNRYRYKYNTHHTHNRTHPSNRNIYYSRTQSYSFRKDTTRYDTIRFNNSSSYHSPNVKQSVINEYSDTHATNVCGSSNLSGIKKSRYQPHISKPLPHLQSRYNANDLHNHSICKSRYDPTNNLLSRSSPYNNNNNNKGSSNVPHQKSFRISNPYPPTNNISSSALNQQYQKLNKSTVYKQTNYINDRISKYPTYSSITHSYVKPQAKIVTHRITGNSQNTTTGPPVKSNTGPFEQGYIINAGDSIPNLANSSNDFPSSKESSVLSDLKLSESGNDTFEDDDISGKGKDFEYINDPFLLETKLSDLDHQNEVPVYPKDSPTYNKCIFPLNKLENRLWYLKYRLMKEGASNGKYNNNVEEIITSLSQYQFYKKNINDTKKFQNCLYWLLKHKYLQLKNHLMFKKIQYKVNQDWMKQCKEEELLDEKWKHNQLNSSSIDNNNTDTENDIPVSSTKFNNRSHINRADYVNDDELEDIMCQIDPGYRYNKQAAKIPMMITDPIKRYDLRFANVNNLIVDKDRWATRLITDKIDTFTKEESDLFIKGYLRFPKKFGKISDYMGKLRSPEECVLHYYRTKKTVDYKALIKKRNMDRIKSRMKSVKRNQDNTDTEENSDSAYSLDVDAMRAEDILERAYEEEMEKEEGEENGSLDSDL